MSFDLIFNRCSNACMNGFEAVKSIRKMTRAEKNREWLPGLYFWSRQREDAEFEKGIFWLVENDLPLLSQ